MSIHRRQRSGRTYYVVRFGYVGGRPREKWFRTQREARDFDANLRLRRSTTQAGPGSLTVAQLAEIWQAQHVATLELATRKGYETHLRMRILPALGAIPVGRLDAPTVHRWVTDLQQVVSKATTASALRSLRSMLRWGIPAGLVHTDPTIGVRMRGMPKPVKPRALTRTEVEKLANSFPLLRDATLIRVAAYVGLRPSEALALKWENVDLEGRRVYVRLARDRDGTFKDPKSHHERTIPLRQLAHDALTQWRNHAPDTELVFPNSRGRMLDSAWHNQFRKLRTEAGFATVTLNNLRDTFATTMIEAGASPKQIQRWMGHADIATTYKHYAAELEGRDDAVLAAADALD